MYIVIDTIDGRYEGYSEEIVVYPKDNHGGPCFTKLNGVVKHFQRKELRTISIFLDEKDREDAVNV